MRETTIELLVPGSGARGRTGIRGAMSLVLAVAIGLGTAVTAGAAPAAPRVPAAGVSAAANVIESAPIDGDVGVRPVGGRGMRIAGTPVVVSRPLSDVARRAIWGTTQHVSYVWGGGHGGNPPSGPDKTDCSGFSRWAIWSAIGYDIGGDSSEGMRTSGQFTKVVGEPQPGDAVFFGRNGTGPSYHMAIYIGRDVNGDRQIAENSSTKVDAHISSLETTYRKQNLLGFYRLTAVKFSFLLKSTTIATTLTPAAAAKGTTSKVSGTLMIRNSTTPIIGVPLYLDEQNPDGSWRTVRRAVTATDGSFTYSYVATGVLRRFRVHYTGNWNPTLSSTSTTMYQTGSS